MRLADDRDRQLAWSMLAQAANGDESPRGLIKATERLFELLYRRLAALIGPDGFSALVARAIYLASAVDPTLRGLRVAVQANTFQMIGLDTSLGSQDAGRVQLAVTALLASFIRLLVTFIGEDITQQLLNEVSQEM